MGKHITFTQCIAQKLRNEKKGKRIIFDGATCSGKTTSLAYLTLMLEGLRIDLNLVPEMATIAKNLGYKIDKDSTLETQPKIFELQQQFEMVSSENGRIPIICDRGALSALPYIKFAQIPMEEKQRLTQEIVNYVRNNPYDYCIYLEPIHISKKLDRYQSMLDKATREVYEQWFEVDKTLFYIPVIQPIDNSKEALRNAKIQRGEIVLKLVEKLLGRTP